MKIIMFQQIAAAAPEPVVHLVVLGSFCRVSPVPITQNALL
jgi:hypothetical protein